MRARFAQWLTQKWRTEPSLQLMEDYRLTFTTLHGQRVLAHLLDTTYCQICPTKDPIDLATHNGRRSVIQEILENLDQAERPHHYQMTVQGETYATRGD